jgi:hypothetical protein
MDVGGDGPAAPRRFALDRNIALDVAGFLDAPVRCCWPAAG